MALNALDYSITAISIALVLIVAVITSISKKAPGGADGFFLAGRNMPWYICAASLFASNVGTEHFVGMAGQGASNGLAVGLYGWTAAYQILMMGWVFGPIYLRCHLTTIPEYLEARYNKYCRFIFVIVTMIAYVTSKLSASLYAGALILEVISGLGLWESVPLIIIATAIYTLAGGLTAVMVTDSIQMLIFLVGGLAGSIKALELVGGISGLFKILRDHDLDYMTHMIHPPDDKSYPWPGTLIGLPIASIWYWCLDQEMAQRVLSARNLSHAQLGAAAGGMLKVIPVLITVVPGMVARALYEQCKTTGQFAEWCANPDESLTDGSTADKSYPWMVVRQFPHGLKGIMMASFLAAMMSSLSSVYNSAATIFTYDVYQRFKYPEGNAPPERLVTVGRITVVALTICTFLWIPVIERSSSGVFLILQDATMHLVGPVVGIAMLAIFWRRANGQGALAGLIGGLIIGMTRFGVSQALSEWCDEFVTISPEGIRQGFTSTNWLACADFLYMSIFLFVFTTTVTVIVSLLTPPPPKSQLEGLMFEDWGFWRKLCCWWREETPVLSPVKDAQYEDGAPLLVNRDDEDLGPSKTGSDATMGRTMRIVTNLAGATVLITVTTLIIIFR